MVVVDHDMVAIWHIHSQIAKKKSDTKMDNALDNVMTLNLLFTIEYNCFKITQVIDSDEDFYYIYIERDL